VEREVGCREDAEWRRIRALNQDTRGGNASRRVERRMRKGKVTAGDGTVYFFSLLLFSAVPSPMLVLMLMLAFVEFKPAVSLLFLVA
jgi:hypothetical protein